MALIKCSECGKDMSSNALQCLNCGNPIARGRANYKGPYSTARLVAGILSIAFSFLLSLRSCALMVSDAVLKSEPSGIGSDLGFALAILVAGIVSIATRNSIKSSSAVYSGALYLTACLFAHEGGEIAGHGLVSFVFSVFFFICAYKTLKEWGQV